MDGNEEPDKLIFATKEFSYLLAVILRSRLVKSLHSVGEKLHLIASDLST